MLQKEFFQFEVVQQQRVGFFVDSNVDEVMIENKVLKEILEEKVKEVDKYLDKYCFLLISYEEFEKVKEILEIEVVWLKLWQFRQDFQSFFLFNFFILGLFLNIFVSEMKLVFG